MTKTITYSFRIAKKTEYVGLKESNNGLNPIVAVDTTNYNSSQWEVEKTEDIPTNKYVMVLDKSIIGTTLVSNSEDVVVTDIYDNNGAPLYYKALIRYDNFSSIHVSGVAVKHDDVFIYVNSPGNVTYKFDDSEDIEVKEEFFPVFVNDNDFNRRFLSDIDGKMYKVSRDGSKFNLFFKSNNISYTVPESTLFGVSLFNTRRRNDVSFYVKSADVHRAKINKSVMNLKYSVQKPSMFVKKITDIVCEYTLDSIYLKHENIFSPDVKIRLVNKDMTKFNDVVYTVRLKDIYMKSGIIVSELITNIANDNDLIILASYEFVSFDTNNFSIYYDHVSDIKEIIVALTPSEITLDGKTYYTNTKIKYFVVDNLGVVTESSDGSKYSDSPLVITTNGKYPNGNIIVSSGAKVYHPDNDNTLLIVARIKPVKKELNIVANNRIALPQSNTHGLRKIEKINKSLFKVAFDSVRPSIFNAGVTSIFVNVGANSEITVVDKNTNDTVLKIDSSKDYKNTEYKEVSDSNVLEFGSDLSKFDRKDQSKISLFIRRGNDYKRLDIQKISKDDEYIFISIKTSDIAGYTDIGYSYNGYPPGRYFKI